LLKCHPVVWFVGPHLLRFGEFGTKLLESLRLQLIAGYAHKQSIPNGLRFFVAKEMNLGLSCLNLQGLYFFLFLRGGKAMSRISGGGSPSA